MPVPASVAAFKVLRLLGEESHTELATLEAITEAVGKFENTSSQECADIMPSFRQLWLCKGDVAGLNGTVLEFWDLSLTLRL